MIIKYLGENIENEQNSGHIERQPGPQELTGETTTDIMSNIYDLEGNQHEMTACAYDDDRREVRGARWGEANKQIFPASERSTEYPTRARAHLGSRATLYL